MICQFVCEAVAGHEITEDGKSAKITFKSGEDHVKLVVPTPEIDNLIDKLEIARAAARAAGVERSPMFQYRVPKTFAVGAIPDQPGNVALTFDMSLPTRVGFGMGSQAARAVGQQLIGAAREAEQARSRAMVAQQPTFQGRLLKA